MTSSTITIEAWRELFPFPSPRAEQEQSINFILDSFLNQGKRFVLCELPVGVGKSAIGYTVARYLNQHLPVNDDYGSGAYFLTPQKILQDQYLRDFGPPNHDMISLKSATGYSCGYVPGQSCRESKQILKLMQSQLGGTEFEKHCTRKCPYTRDRIAYEQASESCTNYSFFLIDVAHARSAKGRSLLVLDECHGIEDALTRSIEISFSERFAKHHLSVDLPAKTTEKSILKWLRTDYKPALERAIAQSEQVLSSEFAKQMSIDNAQSKHLDNLQQHAIKLNKFLKEHNENNWVMNVVEKVEKHGSFKRFEFKPIKVDRYADPYLFRYGKYVLLMSATVIDKDVFCDTLGINPADVGYITMPSPFKIANRPIHYMPVGKMSYDSIDETLPKSIEALKVILEQHKNDKGIIHASNFRIARYIAENLDDDRLLVQEENNREAILEYHEETDRPTVLVSPSMSEGIDLKDELSRFQIIMKLPFPSLQDKIVQKRKNMNPKWYHFATVRTLMQSVGRSIRHEEDYAATYILDECFESFYRRNRALFGSDFQRALDNGS